MKKLSVCFIVFLWVSKGLFAGFWDSAPDEPNILQDPRDIPGIETVIDVKNKSADSKEKEIIIEMVKPDQQNEDSKKLVLSIPNLPQILLVLGVIILFIIYRSRHKKSSKSHRY